MRSMALAGVGTSLSPARPSSKALVVIVQQGPQLWEHSFSDESKQNILLVLKQRLPR